LWLTRVATVMLTGSVVYLAYAFVSLDFSIFYVWRYASSEMSVFYRLAAMLAGQEGTYLLWAWLALLVVYHHVETHSGLKDSFFTQVYALAINCFLMLLALSMNPFTSLPQVPVAGNGLSPALRDWLMPLHISLAFTAYAFMVIPAAGSLAYLTAGESLRVKNHLRASWLCLSLSMTLGGLWANRLLGWIGFWQWDPLQSVTMASWLLLTAALHANVRFRLREYQRLYPLLCISSFLGFIYITFVARSGFYSSVHSFPSTPTWQTLTVFTAIVFSASVVLALRKKVYFQRFGLPPSIPVFSTKLARKMEEKYKKKNSIRNAFSPYNTFYFTILLLILMAFVALWIPNLYLIFGPHVKLTPGFYNTLLYPLFMLVAYLTGVCLLYGRVENRSLARAGAVYFTLSLILGFAVPYTPHALAGPGEELALFRFLGGMSVLSYLPAFFFVAGSILFKTIHDSKIRVRLTLFHVIGVNLVHLGFVVAVLGAIISTSFSTTHTFSYGFNEEGVHKENNGVGMRLLDFRVEKVGSDWLQILTVRVDGIGNMTAFFMKSRQFGFISRPAVHHGLKSDLQVNFEGSLPHQIQTGHIKITVKKQPLISLLWTGCIMLILGVILTLASDIVRRRTKRRIKIRTGIYHTLA